MQEIITNIDGINIIDLYASEGKVLVKAILDETGNYILNDQRYSLIESIHVCPVLGVDKTKWKEVLDIETFCTKYNYIYNEYIEEVNEDGE